MYLVAVAVGVAVGEAVGVLVGISAVAEVVMIGSVAWPITPVG
jgi:TctA family transporter